MAFMIDLKKRNYAFGNAQLVVQLFLPSQLSFLSNELVALFCPHFISEESKDFT